MKRFHIHVGVKDLEKSVQFYSTLFGQKPTKQKEDYAKWMLEDPRVNFAISTRTNEQGVDHLGIQVEEPRELSEISERLKSADLAIYDEGEATCCYAKSNKAWVADPSGIAWEAYQNMGDVEIFSEKKAASEEGECCVPGEAQASGSCC
jgi:catechol 2,3-dioxygenase-like lactoylglutathione lyase family enzyme